MKSHLLQIAIDTESNSACSSCHQCIDCCNDKMLTWISSEIVMERSMHGHRQASARESFGWMCSIYERYYHAVCPAYLTCSLARCAACVTELPDHAFCPAYLTCPLLKLQPLLCRLLVFHAAVNTTLSPRIVPSSRSRSSTSGNTTHTRRSLWLRPSPLDVSASFQTGGNKLDQFSNLAWILFLLNIIRRRKWSKHVALGFFCEN